MSGDERKGVRGGIAGEGQRLYGEDELKIVEQSEGDKDRRVRGLVQIHKPHSQSKPQPHVVRWDKFLPLRSLRVLLVENDDSTRHVVSALLRNCSYQVTPVSNGLEAWKILIDLNNQIDLVLTEVVMPGVSGIGLLSKITSHKICQNIPVIMMSSHDSMGVVLKCLSKGAADFLAKPIRKNELKNLWQHVWRRCHTYGGSGSESGIQTEKSVGVKTVEGSKNDTGNNGDDNDDDVVEDGNGDDTRSLDLLARDGSDNGSGTQSSWTKRASESESSQPMPFWDQLACPPESTFANVIYPRSEAFATSWFLSSMKESGGQNIRHDDIAMGKDLEIGLSRISDCQLNEPSKTAGTSNSVEKKQSSQLDLKIDGQKGKLNISCEKTKAGDIVGNDDHRRESIGSKIPTILLEVSGSKDKVMENCKDLPSLELSLKRMGDVTNTFTNQNILGRSEISAFTGYNTGSTGQTRNVGSCSPPGNNDMSSTSNRSFTKPTFQPVPNPQLMASGNGGGVVSVVPSQESEMGHIHHHHHRHVVDQDSNDTDLSLENMDGKSPQCGSSNNERSVNEVNVANCSLNGSDGGSNLQNGNNYVNTELMNTTVSNNRASIKNAVDNGSGNGIRVGVDQNRSTQREAALIKFRLKRKERCFDKKVRYQSRKKLAEQRPRVRGQFVRQVREI